MLAVWLGCAVLFAVGAGAANDLPRAGDIQLPWYTTWLSLIDRVTRLGQQIDISLSKIDEVEDCYFVSPQGQNSTVNKDIDGVIVREPSDFVSCRITVGPMDRPLIGNWTLCGKHGVDVVHERCQMVNILWNNNNNPNTAWGVTQHPQFNHSVSFGHHLRPVVLGAGSTRSCHVITPNGEDLMLSNDTHYPRIGLVPMGAAARTCAVNIGPIEEGMLGEWTLYGIFRQSAHSEVRLPMRMDLYDKNNPTTQPYNVTTLDPINRLVVEGRIISLEVTGRGHLDACEYRAPNGRAYQFNDTEHFAGVTVIDVGVLITCRISLGPINESVIGDWEIIGRFSSNGIFTETRQPYQIKWSEEDKPEDVLWLPHVELITRVGQFIDITLNNIEKKENCYYINPLGDQGSEETEITGVKVQRRSTYVACRITVGPMEQSLIGNWTLCGIDGVHDRYKRCQTVRIAWHNNSHPTTTWQVNQQRHFTHSVSIRRYLTPVVNNSASVATISCHLITPEGEDLALTTQSMYPRIQLLDVSPTACAVNIGPIERWMLGDWTLYGMFSGRALIEVRLPMTLDLYDEDNPYAKPYNVTTLNPFNRIVHLQTNTTVEVNATGNIDSCQYRAPTGQIFEFNATKQFPGVIILNVGNAIICRMTIGPIEKEMLGEWRLVGQFSNNGIFTERRQTFFVIKEDPENPVVEDREIEYLAHRFLNTTIGATQSVTIVRVRHIIPDTCHIRTPAGRQYIMSGSFNVTGVAPLVGSNIECGVMITGVTEDMIGNWTLISRAFSTTVPVERRQVFAVYVEERVEAFPEDLAIVEANDLHIRLRNPTEQYMTCQLVDPAGNVVSNPIHDTNHIETCGYIVKAVNRTYQGFWEIRYGRTIVYRAAVGVTVLDRQAVRIDDLYLTQDRAANMTIGPVDTVHCRLEDPSRSVVFDGFGRCRLVLETVTMAHYGYWNIQLGMPGRVLIDDFDFFVDVVKAEGDTEVITTVQKKNKSVILTCSVSSVANVNACLFREPEGTVFLATKGIGEDRFVADGDEHSYASNVTNRDCTLRITNPNIEDLGLWRCAIDTDVGTYYSFLPVMCSWLENDPEIQAMRLLDPVLKANTPNVTAIEGEGVTMSCSIQSAIRYCYFRASNSSVFSVTPETSFPSFEYVGDGFSAGDCGVRFKGLMARDSGSWTCHVGLANETQAEQRAQLHVLVHEPIVVRHYWRDQHKLLVEARVHSQRRLRYCRFVRYDGLGFTPDNVPPGYKFIGSLDDGHCLLQIEETSPVNLRPWTIAVKITGERVELSRQTTDNLNLISQTEYVFPVYLWIVIVLISFVILMLGISLGRKKNRRWIRNSIRKSKTITN